MRNTERDGVGAGVAGSPGVDAGARASAEGGGVAVDHGPGRVVSHACYRCRGTGPLRLGSESACTSRTMRPSRRSRDRCPYVAAQAVWVTLMTVSPPPAF